MGLVNSRYLPAAGGRALTATVSTQQAIDQPATGAAIEGTLDVAGLNQAALTFAPEENIAGGSQAPAAPALSPQALSGQSLAQLLKDPSLVVTARYNYTAQGEQTLPVGARVFLVVTETLTDGTQHVERRELTGGAGQVPGSAAQAPGQPGQAPPMGETAFNTTGLLYTARREPLLAKVDFATQQEGQEAEVTFYTFSFAVTLNVTARPTLGKPTKELSQ
jgi:hypothetical protein